VVAAVAVASKSSVARPVVQGRNRPALDEQLSTRLLAWAGGIALIIGAVFFLSLAFSRGWIGPEARVLIGLVGGGIALAVGAWLFERGHGTPALVTIGVGVGVGSLALFAATQLYGFISPTLGLVGFATLAIATALISIRSGSQAVAAFGLVAVAAAPPIVGAEADLATLLFVGAVLVATAMLGMRRAWPWPPILVLLLTAPQMADWLDGRPPVAVALAGIAGYWLVNVLGARSGGAGGRILWGRRLIPIHVGSAATVVIVGLLALDWIRQTVDQPGWLRWAALLALVLAHAAIAMPRLIRRSSDPYGLLVAGVGLGILALAIALEVGGVMQPIADIAIATALIWTAIRFRHRPTAIAGSAYAALAALHLVSVEYPVGQLGVSVPHGTPFASPEGVVVAVAVGAAVFLAWAAARAARHALDPVSRAAEGRTATWSPQLAWSIGLVTAATVVAYAAPFELEPSGQVIVHAALACGLFALTIAVAAGGAAALWPLVAGLAMLSIASLVGFAVVVPLDRLVVDGQVHAGLVPLANLGSVGLALIAIASFVAARLPSRVIRRLADVETWRALATTYAGSVLVYLGSVALVDLFQSRVVPGVASSEIATQAQVALSIAWVVTGAILFAIGLLRRFDLARRMGLALLALATLKVFVVDLSALDVAYRVLSFIGIGVVLLGSSFLASRILDRDGGSSSAAAGPGGAMEDGAPGPEPGEPDAAAST
jgi:uncharacterized membrane protein